MTKAEILRLLCHTPLAELASRARQVVLARKGAHVNCRGLIEFSNICRRNCRYCGLAAKNKKARRYRLTQDQILESALQAAAAGADTIVLQSGEGAARPGWLAEIVQDITRTIKIPVTLSVGEHPERDYELWRLAGASRFLLKHETADPALYASLHPGHSLSSRIRCLKALSGLGYETGDGFMIGLPGQSVESLADDILLSASLKPAMCGAGPFIPHAETPLAGAPAGSVGLALRVLAILRLALPDANLPATTALATLAPEDGQTAALNAGANVLMPGFTPEATAPDYALYNHKARVRTLDAISAIEKAGRSHSLHAPGVP